MINLTDPDQDNSQFSLLVNTASCRLKIVSCDFQLKILNFGIRHFVFIHISLDSETSDCDSESNEYHKVSAETGINSDALFRHLVDEMLLVLDFLESRLTSCPLRVTAGYQS